MFNYNRNFDTNYNVNTSNQHLVFEQRTDHDKDLQALASVKASCIQHRSNGACSVSDCMKCSTFSKLQACMNELALCDQLKVDQMASNIAADTQYLVKRIKCTRLNGFVLAFFFISLVIGMTIFCFLKGKGVI